MLCLRYGCDLGSGPAAPWKTDNLLQETISRYEHLLRQYNELSGKYQGGQKDLVAEKQQQLQHMQDVMVWISTSLVLRCLLTCSEPRRLHTGSPRRRRHDL